MGVHRFSDFFPWLRKSVSRSDLMDFMASGSDVTPMLALYIWSLTFESYSRVKLWSSSRVNAKTCSKTSLEWLPRIWASAVSSCSALPVSDFLG